GAARTGSGAQRDRRLSAGSSSRTRVKLPRSPKRNRGPRSFSSHARALSSEVKKCPSLTGEGAGAIRARARIRVEATGGCQSRELPDEERRLEDPFSD